MAKIRNSSLDNIYGDGKEQILTTDDGKEYTIRNSSLDNIYGDGKEKNIEERGNSSSFLADIIPWWGALIIAGIAIFIQQVIF